jgi:hypothetical protein
MGMYNLEEILVDKEGRYKDARARLDALRDWTRNCNEKIQGEAEYEQLRKKFDYCRTRLAESIEEGSLDYNYAKQVIDEFYGRMAEEAKDFLSERKERRDISEGLLRQESKAKEPEKKGWFTRVREKLSDISETIGGYTDKISSGAVNYAREAIESAREVYNPKQGYDDFALFVYSFRPLTGKNKGELEEDPRIKARAINQIIGRIPANISKRNIESYLIENGINTREVYEAIKGAKKTYNESLKQTRKELGIPDNIYESAAMQRDPACKHVFEKYFNLVEEYKKKTAKLEKSMGYLGETHRLSTKPVYSPCKGYSPRFA